MKLEAAETALHVEALRGGGTVTGKSESVFSALLSPSILLFICRKRRRRNCMRRHRNVCLPCFASSCFLLSFFLDLLGLCFGRFLHLIRLSTVCSEDDDPFVNFT